MNTERRPIPLVLVVVLVIVLAFAAGFFYSQLLLDDPAANLPDEFDILGESWGLLSTFYVNQSALDPEALSTGALRGMLEALGDSYTSYVESYLLASSDLAGSFEGIGALVAIEDGQLTVVSPIVGGPAEQQGVLAGDRILQVDGQSTAGMSLTEAVLMIRGPKGTEVTLLIMHRGETTPLEITIVRQEIKLDSVYQDMLPGDIAYIEITHFKQATADEMADALGEAIDSQAQAVILDLRGNPGGYLQTVVDIADLFLDGGIVLYEADDSGNIIKEWTADAGGLALDLPLAVMVDGGSASGSEVLAGAFQDRGRGVLIGTTTFGKGSVAVLQQVSNDAALYITTARWLTPDGHLIEGLGLTPDYVVELTEEDIAAGNDTQLDFAISYIEGQP